MACWEPSYRKGPKRLIAIPRVKKSDPLANHRFMWVPADLVRGARLLTPGRGIVLAVIVIGALLPLIDDDQYMLDIVTRAGLFVLLATGLNIVVSLAGLLDLGYIAFWAVGAYTAALLASPQFHISTPFLLLIVPAVLFTSIFAVIIGVPTLRLRGDYLAIVTLGFGEIVRLSLQNGGNFTGGPSGITGIEQPSLFGFQFGYTLEPYYYLIYAVCLIALGVAFLIRTSKVGVIWQALRDDELAARAVGIRPLSYYLLAFGLGAGFAGISGLLFATKDLSVSPDTFTVDQSFLVLAIVVLGGLSGRFWPVALSAVFVISLPELLRGFQDYRLVIFGPLLVVVIIVRERHGALRHYLSLRFRRMSQLAGRSTQ